MPKQYLFFCENFSNQEQKIIFATESIVNNRMLEPVSFDTLYVSYYKRSYTFVKSYIHDDLAAEDIAAESLIKLWETMKNRSVKKPIILLFTILKNKALDYLKHEEIKQKAFEKISNDNLHEMEFRISTLKACDPEEILSTEILGIVRNTLDRLPECTRKIFEMSRFDGKPIKNISSELGISIKGVEYHITKALKELRIALKDYLPLLPVVFFLISDLQH